MNARPQAWLYQAKNDLALAKLARDKNCLAQACYHASQAAEDAINFFTFTRVTPGLNGLFQF